MCFASLLLWSQPASRIPASNNAALSVDDVLSVSFFYPFINDYLTIAVRSLRFKKRNAIDKNKKE
ncbi:hypothetical protein F7N54_18145 [Escherichia coli]|nr:hypothetical protein [Escherichia coli]EFA4446602.1 hypothetical protein [Escherichia coli]EFA5089082.1 hypothetical protein [Escherichia coli]EFB1527428.1 hypothetical protein [Escherichia coli]EFB2613603.1 hypothetical protein [Escherichia coli]